MSLTWHRNETQAAFVQRVLRDRGYIAARETLYDLTDSVGTRRSITRLAAIIEPLRKAGWNIATEGGHGELARYRLISIGSEPAPAQLPVWRCTTCGTPARMEPEPLLGGMGQARCLHCNERRVFAKKAA